MTGPVREMPQTPRKDAKGKPRPSSLDVVQEHYSRLADDYDDFLYYSPEFVRALSSRMVTALRLQEEDRLVDLGCGTGMYSVDILRQVPLRNPILGVDPFQEMLDRIPDDANITPICADALSFTRRDLQYDKVLIKETVHHVVEKAELFGNIHRNLTENGIILLVHVPPRVQYPLFEKALRRAEGWHADPDELCEILEATGFRVERSALDYRHRIPKETYFRMVRGQYMSVLTSFSDEEMEEGLREMEEKYANTSVLEFIDHFDYIAGTRI